MAGTVSWQRLRELAAFRVDQGCAISLYLNLDPSLASTAGEVATRINSLLDEAEKSEVANRRDRSHAEKQGLKRDLTRIRAWFDNEFSRDGARGVAVFAAELDNFWSTLALADPVADGVNVGPEFYLAPLVPLVGRGDGALVALVGREKGELYRLRAGRLEAVVDRSEEQPGRHDQGGWSQSRYQRHIENLVHGHLRDVAEELDRRVRRLQSPKVVVVASEETRAEFGDMLSKDVRSAVVGWTSAEAHATPADLLALVTPILEESRAERERGILERWREEAGRNGRASAGWAQTFEAASDGRVEMLLFQEGADRSAWECPACGRAASEQGSCPLDGTQLEKRGGGLDVAVHKTLAHGGTVWAVRHHRDLDPVEGVGALLRY
jgi:peptide chain release factor subunit 1